MSSGGTSEPSFDEARRRFSPGIFMAVLPGRFAQHDKDIGRGRGEANRARPLVARQLIKTPLSRSNLAES